MRKIQIALLVLILAGASWLATIVDDGLGLAWTHNVARNWEQFGFFNLHGKLVYNPGGFQADTQPQIYAGHRAASLYPFFLTQRIFHAVGGPNFYYALVAAVVVLSIWQLLGRTDTAFLLGGITVLTPGYLLWQSSLDPNLEAVMAGFPFCVAVIWMLQKERLNYVQIGLLLVMIMLYSAINWSTVFIEAMLFATLLLLPKVSRKNLFLYMILAAVPAILIVATSVVDKMTNGHQSSSAGLAKIYGDYGWGNSGYGLGVSTKTDFLRLLAVNVIGLLPVILFLCREFWRGRGSGRKGTALLFPLPVLMAIFSVAALRNYFGHHPWMSCNFILMGMILSFVAWRYTRDAVNATDKVPAKPILQWAACVVAFAYGFMILTAYHVHMGNQLALMKFIRTSTPRPGIILIARDTDPGLAGMEERLPEIFDRHVVLADKIASLDAGVANNFILTAVKRDGFQLVASSNGGGGPIGSSWIKKLLGWYSRVIARRTPGDKLEFDEEYYLYR